MRFGSSLWQGNDSLGFARVERCSSAIASLWNLPEPSCMVFNTHALAVTRNTLTLSVFVEEMGYSPLHQHLQKTLFSPSSLLLPTILENTTHHRHNHRTPYHHQNHRQTSNPKLNMGWICCRCTGPNVNVVRNCAWCGHRNCKICNPYWRHGNNNPGGAAALRTHGTHGEGVEAEQASDYPCSPQRATQSNTTEIENKDMPIISSEASEISVTHEVQGMVVGAEEEGQ